MISFEFYLIIISHRVGFVIVFCISTFLIICCLLAVKTYMSKRQPSSDDGYGNLALVFILTSSDCCAN